MYISEENYVYPVDANQLRQFGYFRPRPRPRTIFPFWWNFPGRFPVYPWWFYQRPIFFPPFYRPFR